MIRAAAYARFSSKQQNPLSIEDQLRICRTYAAAHGFTVLDEHVYTDAEITGSTLNRPGVKALLAAASSKPRPFDIRTGTRLRKRSQEVIDSKQI